MASFSLGNNPARQVILDNSGSSQRQSISSGNLFSTGQGSNPSIGFSINGINVASNRNDGALINLNGRSSQGSNFVSSGFGNGGTSAADAFYRVQTGLAIGSAIYDIINTERNYRNQLDTQAYNRSLNERVLSDQENAILNQAMQYGQLGLNPLYMSGNGMSYSNPGSETAPQHSHLNVVQTLQFMDQLKNSQANRNLLEAEAGYQKARTFAQAITNEKTRTQILKDWKAMGKTDAEIKRLEQLMDISSWDYGVTTGDILGMRSTDKNPTWLNAIMRGLSMILGKDLVDLPSVSDLVDNSSWLNDTSNLPDWYLKWKHRQEFKNSFGGGFVW